MATTAIDLSSLNGTNGFRLDGEAEFDSLGSSVSAAGDVNDDGFDDVIAGAPDADPNGDYSGSSYVVFGRSDFSGENVTDVHDDAVLLVGQTMAAELV